MSTETLSDSTVQLKRLRSNLDEEVMELTFELDELLQSDYIDQQKVETVMCDLGVRHEAFEHATDNLKDRLEEEGNDISFLDKKRSTAQKMVRSVMQRAKKIVSSQSVNGDEEEKRRQREVMQKKADELRRQLQELDTSMQVLTTDNTLNSRHMSPDTSTHARSPPSPLRHARSSDEDDGEQQMKTLMKFLSRASMDIPKPELPTFDGDQQMYSRFICSFDTNVDSKPIEGDVKLNYLLQLCKGEAKRVVEPYVFVRGEDGYRQAREALERRYGKRHKVLRAHIESLTKGKPLRMGCREDVFRLLEDLNATQVTLRSMGRDRELDGQDIMQKLVLRLPNGLRRKWVSKSVQVLKAKGREGSFTEFQSFIEDVAEEYDSVYSAEALGEGEVKQKSKYRDTEFNVNYTSQFKTARACVQCGKGCRSLEDCLEFNKLNVRQRLAIVRRHQLCLFCLYPGHLVRACRKAVRCTAQDCKYKHHHLLHEWTTASDNTRLKQVDVSNTTEVTQVNNAGGVHCTTAEGRRRDYKVSLAIVPVTVKGAGGKLIDTFALLDSGSDISLVDHELIKQLNVKGRRQTYSISTVNQSEAVQEGREVYLDVRSLYGGSFTRIDRLWSVKQLPISLEGLPKSKDLERYPHLRGVKMPDVDGKKVSMLIGSDMPELVCPYEVRRGRPGEPCAMRCKLGWVVLGKLPACNGECQRLVGHTNFIQENLSFTCQAAVSYKDANAEDSLYTEVKKLWETDYNERTSGEGKCMSQDDKRALTLIEKSVKEVNGHYQISLPFKEDVSELPNDYGMALKRLQNLQGKLQKNPTLKAMYTEAVGKYIRDGHARKLSAREISNGHSKVWYIPHQPVTNINKPGKVRVVFDCAAQYRGKSLNEALWSGPDLVNSLAGVLLRFRQEAVALASDVEGMFHQVKVPVEDQNSLRFLWYDDGDLSKDPSVYCMTVHLFGAKSSPTCAAYALRTAAVDQREVFSPDTVQTVLRNFYVDDCLKSVSTENEAIQLVTQLKELLHNKGFNLTKWVSNSKQVLETIPVEERASGGNVSIDGDNVERTLGVKWNVSEDVFTFEVSLKHKPFTRRGILSVVSSIFDPLGFVAPMTLGAKKLIQDLTKLEVGWDDAVPECFRTQWSRWLENLQAISGLKVSRCLKPGPEQPSNIQLHIFADASEDGYGVVAYLRCITTGEVTCRLVMGKARLAPIKRVSIPRLELMAAVLASRVKSMIIDELEIVADDVTLWTDSTIVLAYIRNTKSRFKTFVANRLVEIHDRTEVGNWRHVPGQLNPADLASRGFLAGEANKRRIWLHGPNFLKEDEVKWPSSSPDLQTSEATLEVSNTLSVNVITAAPVGINIPWDRYSSWFKVKTICGWWLRLKNNLLAKCSLRGKEMLEGTLSANEFNLAEKAIVQAIQKEVYAGELSRLQMGKDVKLNSPIARLKPRLDNGIIKIASRVETPVEVSPIILPGNHAISKLIIRHTHVDVGHLGLNSTLAKVRETYWLTKGVASIRHVLSKCVTCRRQHARPVQQIMANLPEVRTVPDEPPFTDVGLDFFGPFLVRQRRSRVKRYGMIFVCMTTRAVHIEITHSLDTNSVLMGLSRHIARRGKPKSVYCDNGTSIVKAHKVLSDELKSLQKSKLYQDCGSKGIEFMYRAPLCSSMGGVYERMIRSVRSILFALCRQQTLDDERLSTFMCQVEKILNSRPITHVSGSITDPRPLTPNMLLLLRSNECIPEALCNKDDNYHQRRWAQVQYLSDVFWRRWVKEYLPSLSKRQKWLKETQTVKRGDVVLLQEPNCARGSWPLGLVIDTHISHDGMIRTCTVKKGNKILKRALSSICMLEVA